MAENKSFNPNQEWLGIAKRSPNYFELCGVSPKESDEKKIAALADQALARVRGFRPGEHHEDWSKLIDRITRAKAVLVKTSTRAAYLKKLKAASQKTTADAASKGDASAKTSANSSRKNSNPAKAASPGSGKTSRAGSTKDDSRKNPRESTAKENVTLPEQMPGAPIAVLPPSVPVNEKSPLSPEADPVAEIPTLPAGGGIAEIDPMAPVAIPLPVAKPAQPAPETSNGPDSKGLPAEDIDTSEKNGKSQPLAEEANASSNAAPVGVLPTESATDRVNQQYGRKRNQPVMIGLVLLLLVAVGVGAWIAGGMFAGSDSNQVASSTEANSNEANSNDAQSANQSEKPNENQSETNSPVDRESTPNSGTGDGSSGSDPRRNQPGDNENETGLPEGSDPESDIDSETEVGQTDPAGQPMGMDEDGANGTQPENDPGSESEPEKAAPLSNDQVLQRLSGLKQQLADREIEQAKLAWEELRELERPEEFDPAVESMGRVIELIEQFWLAYDEAVSDLQSGEELLVDDDQVVVVVEVSPDRIVYRSGGQNQRIAPREIEPGLAKVIAARSLQDSAVERRIVLGAFYAIEGATPEIAAQRAREYWEEAELMGGDVQSALAFLEGPLSSSNGMLPEESRPDPSTLLPIPESSELAAISKAFSEKFAEEIKDAKTPRRRADLVGTLTEELLGLEPPESFVYLREIAIYQARSGNLTDAFATIFEIGQTYQVENLDRMKVQALVAASEVFVGEEYCKEVADAAIDLAESIKEAGEASDVGLLTRAATTAAEKSHDAEFTGAISEKVSELRKSR